MTVTIRQWKREDAADLAESLSNPKVQANLRDGLPYPYTEKDALEYIDAMLASDPQKTFAFAIDVDGKAVGGKLGTIEKAIVEKKCVCLKRYSSASGIRDRRVEPFKVTGCGKFVWCYDLEGLKSKHYSISRAADILLLNEAWSHQREHKALDTDIFNWSGDKAMHIEIQMDNMASNTLKDEYPQSEKYLISVNGGEEWILSTDIYDCKAPGRFVVGLLDHVKILYGEELKSYVDNYIRGQLHGLIVNI